MLDYSSMFGKYLDLRVYFKRPESYTPEDVQTSERFEKHGKRLFVWRYDRRFGHL